MDINKIHGEIWYQVAYTIGLLEQGNKLSKEDIKDVSDKIYDILSSQLEPPVMQKANDIGLDLTLPKKIGWTEFTEESIIFHYSTEEEYNNCKNTKKLGIKVSVTA